MYIFINEHEIIQYNNEVLKRYVGNRLVKTISNPTDDDLREFGYMELREGDVPTYDEETQYLDYHYELGNDAIKKVWTVKRIETEIEERGGEV